MRCWIGARLATAAAHERLRGALAATEGPPNIAALHFATVRRHLAALGRLEATTAAGQEQRDEAKAALPDRYEIGLAVDVRSRPR